MTETARMPEDDEEEAQLSRICQELQVKRTPSAKTSRKERREIKVCFVFKYN